MTSRSRSHAGEANKRRSAALVTALALTAVTAGADEPRTLQLDVAHSRVEYHISHPVSAVTDVAGTPEGSLAAEDSAGVPHVRGTVRVDLRALQTGITMRDHHIKSPEYLDVEKFPQAEFRLDSLVAAPANTAPPRLPKDAPPPSWSGLAEGALTLHGVSRDVRVPVALWWMQEPAAGSLRVVGDLTIAFADHQMKRPKKFIFAAGKTVDVHLDLLFLPGTPPH